MLVGEVLDLVVDLKEKGSTILTATHVLGPPAVADQLIFLSVIVEK